MAGRRGIGLARNAETLLDKLFQTPAGTISGEHGQIVKVEITVAVCIGNLLVIDFRQPVIGCDGSGVGKNQTTDRIGDGGIFLYTPVFNVEVFINRLLIIQIGGSGISQFLALFAVEDIGFGNLLVAAAGKNGLDAVLNVFHGYGAVFYFGLKFRGCLQREEINNGIVVFCFGCIKCFAYGIGNFGDIKVYNFAVSFHYLVIHSFTLSFLSDNHVLSDAADLDGWDVRADCFRQREHFFSVKGREAGGTENVTGIFELLKVVFRSAGNPFCGFNKTFPGMQTFDNCCPKFRFYNSGEQQIPAFLNRGYVKSGNTGCNGIERRAVFHIHCNTVYQTISDQCFQPVWEGAVGIQFDFISELSDFTEKKTDILMEKRFAARNGYPIQDAAALFQKREDFFFSELLCKTLREYQRSIVTERTAEITAAGKNRAGNFAGIIEQRQFLKPGNNHDILLCGQTDLTAWLS